MAKCFLFGLFRVACSFLLLSTPPLQSQGSSSSSGSLSIGVYPALFVPIGESYRFLLPAAQAGVISEYVFPKQRIYTLGAIQYQYSPLKNSSKPSQSVSIINALAGVGLRIELHPQFDLRGFGGIGYYYSLLNDPSISVNGGDPTVCAGVQATFSVNPSFQIFVSGTYTNYLQLAQGITTTIGCGYRWNLVRRQIKKGVSTSGTLVPLSSTETLRSLLKIEEIQLLDVFPVLHKFYDTHPIGTVRLLNESTEPLKDIKVSFFVSELMTDPKVCAEIPELSAGDSKTVDLFALFGKNILDITEATKVSSALTVEYTASDRRYTEQGSSTLRVYDRNAMIWDDSRKAAAFITSKEPSVLTLSKNTISMAKESGFKTVPENLRAGIAFIQALSVYGMTYVTDPKTPYAEFSKSSSAIDFLLFPRQALEYRAGDCDDLSILYCSLLESVGVETAFITVPGHILAAFALGMRPDEAKRGCSHPDALIFRGENTWMPIETTVLGAGFLSAWQAGARLWREYEAHAQAELLPVHEAWRMYEPVGLYGSPPPLALPSQSDMQIAYTKELERFVEYELSPQVAAISEQIRVSGNVAALTNKLGVLYAKYGQFDKAAAQFSAILEQREYVPALNNMGNIYFLEGDFKKALSFYERALKLDPKAPHSLLSMSRLHHRLENYGMSKELYDELVANAPTLAADFAYLASRSDESVRANENARIEGNVPWQEQE